MDKSLIYIVKLLIAMSYFKGFDRFVNCPSCGSHWATTKYTKTDHLMLRCDECKLIIFANSLDSEDGLREICHIQKSSSCDYSLL
jgi:predicted  nucleic acid-binding Zn ribbon protein